MADVRNLIWHLRRCHERDEIPNAQAADAKLWYLALGELVTQGALDAAAATAGSLRAAFPASEMIARLSLLLESMPPPSADLEFAAFADRRDMSVQTVRRDGSRTVVLAFCGRHGNLGMPVPIAHRWFDLLGSHVIYLRDLEGELYLGGITSLAADRSGTVTALRSLCDDLGAERRLCYGNSTGAYAALLYALPLEASAVLALNTVAAFPGERMATYLSASATSRRHAPPDLGHLYASATIRPCVRLVHSEGNGPDSASAATMAGVEGIVIEAVPAFEGHDAQVALIARRRFAPLLLDFARSWHRDPPVPEAS